LCNAVSHPFRRSMVMAKGNNSRKKEVKKPKKDKAAKPAKK
jgi:hypothetical protein